MLLDSNIIIYSAQPEHAALRQLKIPLLFPHSVTLKFWAIIDWQQADCLYFEQFFQVAQVLPMSQTVLEQAVVLRQMRRIALADAIIAGTTIVHNLTLVTRNAEDFRSFTQLRLLNPIDI